MRVKKPLTPEQVEAINTKILATQEKHRQASDLQETIIRGKKEHLVSLEEEVFEKTGDRPRYEHRRPVVATVLTTDLLKGTQTLEKVYAPNGGQTIVRVRDRETGKGIRASTVCHENDRFTKLDGRLGAVKALLAKLEQV